MASPVSVRRLNRFLAVCKALKIAIAVGYDADEKRNLFGDNVENRYDDADPDKLTRYVLVLDEDDRFQDVYRIECHRSLRSLTRGVLANGESSFVAAFDLDAGKVFRPVFRTTVTLTRPARPRRSV